MLKCNVDVELLKVLPTSTAYTVYYKGAAAKHARVQNLIH